MLSSLRVFVTQEYRDDVSVMLHSVLDDFYKIIEVDSANDADLLVLTGGEDIADSLYGGNEEWSERDARELHMLLENPCKPVLGICRGAQLLHCLYGGTLVKDITSRHPSSHYMDVLYGGGSFMVNSLHHQACRMDGASEPLAHPELIVIDEQGEQAETLEAFTVPYGFCVQFHPEWMYGERYEDASMWFRRAFREWLGEYVH